MIHLREYPVGFGKRLLEAYHVSCSEPPRKDLRRKFALAPNRTDKELFMQYPMGQDQWFDAALPETFWYLYGSRSLTIPDSWVNVTKDFAMKLQEVCVPYLFMYVRSLCHMCLFLL